MRHTAPSAAGTEAGPFVLSTREAASELVESFSTQLISGEI
jgi:hypothetical protein